MSDSGPDPEKPRASTPLGGRLAAECEALRNDVEQARELAADFQGQLADKANEVAQVKAVLERSQQHVNRLDGHVQQLRRERHELANQAMNAEAMALQLAKRQAEVSELRALLETLRTSSEADVGRLLQSNAEQFQEIEKLRAELQRLKGGAGSFSDTQKQVAELTATVAALQQRLGGTPPPPRQFGEPEPESDVINLSRPDSDQIPP